VINHTYYYENNIYSLLVCYLLIYIGVKCAKIIMTKKYIIVGSIHTAVKNGNGLIAMIYILSAVSPLLNRQEVPLLGIARHNCIITVNSGYETTMITDKQAISENGIIINS